MFINVNKTQGLQSYFFLIFLNEFLQNNTNILTVYT